MKKNINIEIIRIIATFLVLLIHLSSPFFYNKDLFTSNSIYWLLNNFYYSFSRFSVPVFFIATAYIYFYVSKQLDLKKRLLKIIIPYIAWSFIYFLYTPETSTNPNIISSTILFLKTTIFSNVSIHLWFIPTFIGYITILPILKTYLIDSADENKKLISILVLCFSAILPFFTMIQTSLSQNSNFLWGINQFNLSLPVFLIYPIGIFFIYSHKLNKYKKNTYLLFFLLCSTLVFILNAIYSYHVKSITEMFFGYTSPLVFAASLSFFIFLNSIDFSSLGERSKKIIYSLASSCFGIYLAHIFIRDALQYFNLIYWGNPGVAPILNSIAIFLLSYIFVSLVKKIPVVKNIV